MTEPGCALDGRGAALRLVMGLVGLAAAAALSAWLLSGGAARAWRFAVFPLALQGVLGVLQAATRT